MARGGGPRWVDPIPTPPLLPLHWLDLIPSRPLRPLQAAPLHWTHAASGYPVTSIAIGVEQQDMGRTQKAGIWLGNMGWDVGGMRAYPAPSPFPVVAIPSIPSAQVTADHADEQPDTACRKTGTRKEMRPLKPHLLPLQISPLAADVAGSFRGMSQSHTRCMVVG